MHRAAAAPSCYLHPLLLYSPARLQRREGTLYFDNFPQRSHESVRGRHFIYKIYLDLVFLEFSFFWIVFSGGGRDIFFDFCVCVVFCDLLVLPVFCLCFLCFGLVLLFCVLESLLSPTGQVSVRDKYDSNKSHFTNISSCSPHTCCEFAGGLKIQHYCCLALVHEKINLNNQ